MPAAKKITKRLHPKPVSKPTKKHTTKPTKKHATKPTKKPTKKTVKKGGGCGCAEKSDITGGSGMKSSRMNGGFIDMDSLAKLSIPFGLLVAKAGLEDFLKKKKTVHVKTPVKKVSVTQKTVIRSPSKKVVINRRFL